LLIIINAAPIYLLSDFTYTSDDGDNINDGDDDDEGEEDSNSEQDNSKEDSEY